MKNNKLNCFWMGALVGALSMFMVGIISVGVSQIIGINLKMLKEENVKEQIETKQKLKKLNRLIDEKYLYFDEVNENDLQEGIYSGYVEALGDPYSVYYNAEEAKAFKEAASGEYSGIGVVFSQNKETNITTAVQIYTGSPAEEAGLKEGDILYKVNGVDVSSQDLNHVVQDIRGVEGTTVEITVLRGGQMEEVTREVERRIIQVETVTFEMKENQIGYIRITEFDNVTYEQFETAFYQLKEKGMQGLVVDLRSNPGGNLITVCQILDLVLPEGTIVYTEDKYGEKQELSSDEEHQFDKPMAVLVNENSASASEIFAGAIQDYGMGTIVGTTTYGKGIVQQIIELDDGSCVKLTVEEYFTPNGRNIHGKGIQPDVEVAYEVNQENPEADNQLEAALKELKK